MPDYCPNCASYHPPTLWSDELCDRGAPISAAECDNYIPRRDVDEERPTQARNQPPMEMEFGVENTLSGETFCATAASLEYELRKRGWLGRKLLLTPITTRTQREDKPEQK